MASSSIPPCISASVVENNDDLLTEILLRLPIKYLLKFKSVSKRWLSFISSPTFSHQRTPYPATADALFLRSSSPVNDSHYFLDLNPNPNATFPSNARAPFRSLSSLLNQPNAYITQSCNGLLLCCSITFDPAGKKISYFVMNPTTKQYSLLPPIGTTQTKFDRVYIMSLAFDPSESPHYKVVCVKDPKFLIYSSDNGMWKVCGSGLAEDAYFGPLGEGVFWNGVVHWFGEWGYCYYFTLDDDQLRELPPPHPADYWSMFASIRPFWYFGESRDHLHLIEVEFDDPSFIEFDVYEMERDHSGWYIKYHVDLHPLPVVFPDIRASRVSPWDPGDYENFSVCSVIRSEADEDSYLVLQIPGKIVRYNFQEKTFHKLYDILPEPQTGVDGNVTQVHHYNVYQYIETLYCV